ncbi:MAG TPA: carboxypeptidase regulatory-like domain-containing protein [Pirellulales bacterium]|jgi:beta-lactamase regulating signal transducer with metallopeptidase domain/protocatechuate 3,4-dioxygenase beta subunit
MTSLSAYTWLLHGILASTFLLTLAALGVSVLRQPADRLRLIQWALVGTLAALALLGVPQLGAFSLGLLRFGEPVAAPRSAEQSGTTDILPATPVSTMNADVAINAPALEPSETTVSGTNLAEPRDAGESSQTTAAVPDRAPRWELMRLLPIGVCVAYGLGVFVFSIRWASAYRRLSGLRNRARQASPEVYAELSRIAGPRARPVCLLESDQIAGPVTWGVLRPVIMIPANVVREGDVRRLRYYLGHEWAHVVRRDFATWHFATFLQMLLFYQPLFWWLRGRLAVCMDQLADADASEQGSSTADYAEFLVKLARLRLAPNSQLMLGMGDRRSTLRERIVFLLNDMARPRPTCPRGKSLAIGAAVLLLVVSVSVVRLDAGAAPGGEPTPNKETLVAALSAEDKPAEDQKASPAPESTKDVASITYDGIVKDALTDSPIEGVQVVVWHKLSRDPKTGGWSTLGKTEHMTDAAGHYSFTLPPEEVADDSLYIEVEAHHPTYASKGRSGYSHAMIRKNLTKGEPPFYSTIKLWSGEPITGTVVNPEGEPLADVEISMYAVSDHSKKKFGRGSFEKTKTDAAGGFRIVPPTPGDGVLWIRPAENAPQAHRIGNRRGDWGRLVMEHGTAVRGRVLDAKGAPVAGVRVEARAKSDGEKADEFLRSNAVAQGITRNAVTGPDGEYALLALPDGEYNVRMEPNHKEGEYDPPPLEQVFLQTKLAIVDGKAPEPFDIRAVPHVVIRGTYLDSADKPRRGHEFHLFGRMDGQFYFANSSTPGQDGKLIALAPHGADVELDLSTNEHSSLRWRMSHDAPLQRGRRVKLGVMEEDLSGFEIIRYTAPILLVKPVDEQGNVLPDCQPVLNYTRETDGKEEMTAYTTGGHVSFEKQPDGRWRSSQLLPDEPFSIDLKKEGYATTAQKLSLAEGEDREVVLVMKKEAAAANGDADKPAVADFIEEE